MARSDYTFDGKKLDANVRDAILNITHSASMNSVAQLTIQLADTLDFDYLSKGIFDAGVLITSDDLAATYEIAAVEVRDNPAPQSVAISARSKPAQFFKKTKTAMVKSGVSPSDFLKSEAASQGGSAVTQDSPKRTISRVNNENQQESTWDVMKKIAGELKYEFWEYKGIFYFGKEDFWLDKPVKWTMSYDKGKPVPEDNTVNIDDATYITTFGVPNCRRSEDAKDVTMTVSLSVEREQAEQLAPGDPVYFYGVPTWENKYLITSMESDLLEPASVVSVQLSTIIKKKKKKSQAGGGGDTSYEEVFPAPCKYNLGAGTRFARENGVAASYPWSTDGRWVLGKEAGSYTACPNEADIRSAYSSWNGIVADSREDVEGIE